MNRLLRTRASRGVTVAALTGFATAVVVAATPAVASADTTLTVRYPVHGSTFIKAANATVALGPGTALSFSTCKGPLNLTFTVKTTHFPWHLNAKSFAGGVTTGTITGIHATLSGPGCSATVDGTGATANNGSVTAKYTNSTGKLATTGAGNLHVYDVSGCAGLINSGDATSFVGSYAISPKQTITSP